jgi:spore coat polysaccharide biosynthesis protein SpsF (cytidylyltransferase family)
MPYVSVYVDTHDIIEELEDDDIIEVMSNRGFSCFKGSISGDNVFASVEHLLDCGMADTARAEALTIVSKILGRTL